MSYPIELADLCLRITQELHTGPLLFDGIYEEGPFGCIYADPPWFYNDRLAARKDNKEHTTRFGFGAGNHYPLLKTEEICKFPVQELADKNSVLALWSTPPNLPDALTVMKAWGFTYKTILFSWEKVNKDGSPWFGVGHYSKSNMEHVLLGVRGRPIVWTNSVSSVVRAMHLRQQSAILHSGKPLEVRTRIERLFCGPYLELFARTKTPGWSAWGNQL